MPRDLTASEHLAAAADQMQRWQWVTLAVVIVAVCAIVAGCNVLNNACPAGTAHYPVHEDGFLSGSWDQNACVSIEKTR